MSYETLRGRRVLLVDDSRPFLEGLRRSLEDVGCLVHPAHDVASAEAALEESTPPFDLAIVDFYIPQDHVGEYDRVMRGEELMHTISKRSPMTRIVGMSENLERFPFSPGRRIASGFVFKRDLPHDGPPVALLETLEGILLSVVRSKPRMFIVHGHDDALIDELKAFLEDKLELGPPVVLRERPNLGRTIVEKFEHEARGVDLVFVLLTPDDAVALGDTRRSRQNVIFEAGFFYGKLQRTTGRVFLLRRGPVELPSDIGGIIYIDVATGLTDACDDIKREIRALGWLE
jgi:CheY-like chemotaxis protein